MPIDIPWSAGAAFRAARSGLSQPLPTLADAARALVGAQSQIEAPSRWGLALRTAGLPSAAEVTRTLLEERTVVRAWGQRDTVHIYAVEDWPLIATGQRCWPASARTGPMQTDEELADFVALIETLEPPFTRSSLLGQAPSRLVEAFRANPVNADPPERMAITRLIWAAGREGWLCSVQTVGREQGYAARRRWVPDLPWPPLTPDEASVAVLRRLLRTWAPARPQDLAHTLGARVSDVRTWLEALADETVEVRFHGRDGHLVLRDDLEALRDARPVSVARLLPAYDTQMMTHAWKEPLFANFDDRTKVWAKAARVAATVVHNGRFVATWTHAVKRKRLELGVDPLQGADAPEIAAAIREAVSNDGAALAAHLGVGA